MQWKPLSRLPFVAVFLLASFTCNTGLKSEVRQLIQVVTGRSGSGKTKSIYEFLAQLERESSTAGDPGITVWLIVPEQFTLQAERELISYQNLEGLLRVQVLSFRKLVDRVLDSTQASQQLYLDELGRHMLLKRILLESADRLEAYRSAHRKPGFITMMGDFLAELKRSGIGPAKLRDAGEDLPRLTAAKISDIALVFEQFEALKAGALIDEEDRYDLAAERLSTLAGLAGSTVCIDGFSGFTGQEFKLIESLARTCKCLRTALTLDPEHLTQSGIFLATAETYKRLETIAQDTGCGFTSTHRPTPLEPENPLRHIEQQLFEFPQVFYEGVPDGIHLMTFDTTWDEAEFVALEIGRLVAEQGWRYSDVAVVSNAPEIYDDLLTRVFNQYQIPTFHDNRRDIAGNPLARLILAMLEAYQKDFRLEPLFRGLKTGLTDLKKEEWERLEIFAIENGIRGKRWKLPVEDAQLEPLREKLANIIGEFESVFKETDSAAGYSAALFKWLVNAGIRERYEVRMGEIRSQSGFEAAFELIQGWNMISDLLDQIVSVSPEAAMKLGDYRAILEAGFAAYETGMLPQDFDTVLIGKVEHSRSHPIKALFLVGAADGILPSNRDGSGLLTEDEKLSLRACQLDLKSISDYLSMNESFSIHLAMAKPSEALYVSCAFADGMGRSLRPSYLLDRLVSLFPKIKIEHVRLDELSPSARASNYNAVIAPITRQIREWLDGRQSRPELEWAAMLRHFESQPAFEARARQLRKAFHHNNRPKPLSQAATESLFGMPLTTSISRLERFAACPFKHFVDFGLRPARVVPYEVDLPEVGRLFHSAVERFALSALADGHENAPQTQEEVSALIGQIVDESVERHGKSVFANSERNRYVLRRVKRTGTRAAMTILDHLAHSHFKPKAFELAFSSNRPDSLPPILIELADGQRLLLEGRIDRIDLCETDDGVAFVQIVDYKSGSETLDLSKIHHGLQLQLVAYMDAVLNDPSILTDMPQVYPGGLFYFKIDDPMVDLESVREEDVERELLKKLRLNGLVIGGSDMAKRLDQTLESETKSVRIPFELKRDGTPTAGCGVLEASTFESLRRYVRDKIAALGTEILKGDIDVAPYRFGSKTACDYCDLMGICQFDLTYGGNHYRNLKKLKGTQWMDDYRGGESQSGEESNLVELVNREEEVKS